MPCYATRTLIDYRFRLKTILKQSNKIVVQRMHCIIIIIPMLTIRNNHDPSCRIPFLQLSSCICSCRSRADFRGSLCILLSRAEVKFLLQFNGRFPQHHVHNPFLP